MRHQIDDSVSNEINEIISSPISSTPEGVTSLVGDMSRHASGFYYIWQDADGRLLAGNLPALQPQVGIREWSERHHQAANEMSAIRGRGVMLSNRYLFVGWSTHQLLEMSRFVTAVFGWGLVASLLLALSGGAIMSRRLMRKIEDISETSRIIVNGDLRQRVSVQHNGDEFDHLALSINAMLDRIESLMNDLREMTTDIAHDLRTPLTRLRNRLEVRDNVALPQLHQVLADARRDIDLILEIFSALVRIAQIESGGRKSRFTAVVFDELLDTIVEIYRPSAEERHQCLIASIEPRLVVTGDKELLMQMFANLIENALRHTPDGATIHLTARREGTQVAVAIADNGPGIPEDMRSKVLQRFFRLEGSRTTPGSGLGLSLAKAIATLHDATLQLRDNVPGLLVELRFALAANLPPQSP
ncbi:MAG: HAMP domain-containing sensor histidine kinase [Gammaproteobacteria bacterium]